MSNRLEALRVFCAAADAANFRDAAIRLSVSPQVVTRAVRELEDELGEPLFHRSTRGVQLTDFGRTLAEQARGAVGGVDALFHRSDRRALSQHAGTVRLSVPNVLGRRFIPHALAPVLEAHPGLVLDLRLSEQMADAVGQHIDVGVRVGRQPDSRFVARSVDRMALKVVAAPALVARTGVPGNLDELQRMPLTALVDSNSGRLWSWAFSRKRQMPVATPAFVTDDTDAECSAVLAGIGFGQLVAPLADPWLASGHLVSVLDADAPEPWPVHVWRAQRTPVPARVRVVYDALVRMLASGTTPLR
ncbi:LysR family transcriptional regulator [Variovorax sp. KK3]|uniref:LysR family transcriptional regulator n=1 Tax=Variovorax sp. KK3 TaxID=1855728 RepID=UPI00097C8134|nr:LysR family transcriptional regulator [Variovorax sp. KK3]